MPLPDAAPFLAQPTTHLHAGFEVTHSDWMHLNNINTFGSCLSLYSGVRVLAQTVTSRICPSRVNKAESTWTGNIITVFCFVSNPASMTSSKMSLELCRTLIVNLPTRSPPTSRTSISLELHAFDDAGYTQRASERSAVGYESFVGSRKNSRANELGNNAKQCQNSVVAGYLTLPCCTFCKLCERRN
jgi:hypothetical protein